MKSHLKHLAMCSPMIAVALVIAVATGNFAFLLPAVICVVMMGMMMGSMSGGERGGKN